MIDISKLKKYSNEAYKVCDTPGGYDIIPGDEIRSYNDLVNRMNNKGHLTTKDSLVLKNEWNDAYKEINEILNKASGLTSYNRTTLNKDIRQISKLLN